VLDHAGVVAGQFHQGRAELAGQAQGALVGVEVTAVLAAGDHDPAGQGNEPGHVEMVGAHGRRVAADEQLYVGGPDLGTAGRVAAGQAAIDADGLGDGIERRAGAGIGCGVQVERGLSSSASS
jgi:hypothetical protein